MAHLKRIKAVYTGSGGAKFEPLEGFTGGSCTTITEAAIKALGGGDVVQELKSEYYQTETEKVTVGGG
jgi:hypothetical protein